MNTHSFQQALLAWFRREARDLPWRRTRDPYAIWVSEIMLQQTRVEQGRPYYERFMAALPTVKALAAAKEDRVLKLWEGLGYYTRARNLYKAARMIVREHGGRFPGTAAGWLQLPGVGRYTAGAIASIAFAERVPVVDGNVKRVLSRLFDISASVDGGRTQRRLWTLAESLAPWKSPGDFNQAMMELGARICGPRQPRCLECPVRRHCRGYAKGTQNRRPVRRPRKRPPHRETVVAVICCRGRYLLCKRPSGGLLGGLWEFPGGNAKRGETRAENLVREMKAALGADIEVDEHVATVTHGYSHFRVTMYVYRCRLVAGVPRLGTYAATKWVLRKALAEYPMPKANHKFLHLL